MILPSRLKDRIDACDSSQAKLARAIGVTPQAISKMINGGTHDTRRLYQIARELRTSPEYLTGESNDPDGHGHFDELTSEEREWVQLLRELDNPSRASVMQIVKSLARPGGVPTFHSPALGFRAG